MIASAFILAHLTAVIAPPLAFQCRGPRGLSPAVAALLNPTSAYGQLLYLDRGYAFFAPDPGPSHLLAVELSSGSKSTEREGSGPAVDAEVSRVPSLDDQWPRLLYHRHFMLAEFLNDAYQPALPSETASLVGPDLSAEELQLWRLGRDRYDAILNSMIRHVETQNQGKTVRIDRLEHVIPDFVGFATRQIKLNDDSTYVLLEDIPITLETLLGTPPEALPVPDQPTTAPDSIETEPVPAPSGERVNQAPTKTSESPATNNDSNSDTDPKTATQPQAESGDVNEQAPPSDALDALTDDDTAEDDTARDTAFGEDES